MKYSSTVTVPLPAFEGVSLVLNRMSSGKRERFSLENADMFDKNRELSNQFAQLSATAPKDEAQWTAAFRADFSKAQSEWLLFNQYTYRIRWITWAVRELQGLEIDGVPATVQSLIADGPEDLLSAVWLVVQEHSGLTVPEQKNSPSPSISSAPVDGETPSSSVENVNGMDGTLQLVTAGDTRPAA